MPDHADAVNQTDPLALDPRLQYIFESEVLQQWAFTLRSVSMMNDALRRADLDAFWFAVDATPELSPMSPRSSSLLEPDPRQSAVGGSCGRRSACRTTRCSRRSHRRTGTERAATGPSRERPLSDPGTTCSIATSPADPPSWPADTADTVHRSDLGPTTTAQAAARPRHGENLLRQLGTVGPCKSPRKMDRDPRSVAWSMAGFRTASVLTGDPPARLRRSADGCS